MAEENRELLASLSKRWAHVRKSKPLYAKLLTEDQEIETLEGKERAHAGDWLCKGLKGEFWPQKEIELLRKYDMTNSYQGEFRRFVPKATISFYAAQVPPNRGEFTVTTQWGTQHGKPGDYVVKNAADQDVENPADVWIVDKKIFNLTYTRVLSKDDVTFATMFMQMCNVGGGAQDLYPPPQQIPFAAASTAAAPTSSAQAPAAATTAAATTTTLKPTASSPVATPAAPNADTNSAPAPTTAPTTAPAPAATTGPTTAPTPTRAAPAPAAIPAAFFDTHQFVIKRPPAREDRSASKLVREWRSVDSPHVLQVRHGDITGECVGAIVNAANSHLAHGAGVAGAIVRRGGDEIDDESEKWVRRWGPVPTGAAAPTAPGRLPAQCVIHAVGPVVHNAAREAEMAVRDAELTSAVWVSLVMADALGLDSISLPAISSGIFGFPKPRCAVVMYDTALRFVRERPQSTLKQIRFTNFDSPTVECFIMEHDKRFPPEKKGAASSSSAATAASAQAPKQ